MIFSELYSAYYNAVAKIIEKALDSDSSISEKEIKECIFDQAFSESVLTILPALRSGKWKLFNDDMSPIIKHKPTMPLTNVEKQWLKAISEDPRIRLFGVELPDLEDVQPLFTKDDYRIYDCYNDGDPYEDEAYIKHFRTLLSAIKNKMPVRIRMTNKQGRTIKSSFIPTGFEYSMKDDKIRVITKGCKFRRFNLGKITYCELYDGQLPLNQKSQTENLKDLTLKIYDERNALERAMLHFAHFEKRVEKCDKKTYILHLSYYEDDETEIVIRVLSFGPCVKVLSPQSFIELIKKRLISQKSCELK